MKKGFTLAEVLITLVIIGVIAALTIPTLMKANKRSETETKLKKAFSIITNAIKLSEVENGPYIRWSWITDSEETYNEYLRPYLKFTQECTEASPCNIDISNANGTNPTTWAAARGGYLADGMLIQFNIANDDAGAGDLYLDYIDIMVDLNGSQRPNQWAKDIFIFRAESGGLIGGFYPSATKAGCQTLCENEAGGYCTGWIHKNGWKIPDNYPWL